MEILTFSYQIMKNTNMKDLILNNGENCLEFRITT